MHAPFPSSPLFHYSSLPDLTALLSTQSLALTSLDSSTELNQALSFIQGVIVNTYPSLSADLFNLDNMAQYPILSFSLTSQKDSANLWQRFYPGGGYSFSIDTAQLSAMMDANNLTLSQCLYDDTAKTNFIINTIVAASPEEFDPNSDMFARRIKLINRNILNYAGILKDASRSAEQEWRIIASYSWENILMGPSDPPDALSVNVDTTVPSATVPIANVNIQEIVIGPHQDIAQAKVDCDQLVSTYGLTNIVVTESGVPY